MFRKQIENLITTGMNFFFNFDDTFCYQIFSITLIIIGTAKLLLTYLRNEFYDGMLTVKEDILSFRTIVSTYKDRYERTHLL